MMSYMAVLSLFIVLILVSTFKQAESTCVTPSLCTSSKSTTITGGNEVVDQSFLRSLHVADGSTTAELQATGNSVLSTINRKVTHLDTDAVADDVTLQPGESITVCARTVTGTAAYVTVSLSTREDQ